MSAVAPDSVEVLRAELVEALVRMVNRVIRGGKAEAQSALNQLEVICTTLAGAAHIDDFRTDLDAAKRVLALYLLT